VPLVAPALKESDMGKKSSPPPPDYTAAAEKTAASNQAAAVQQTWANRPEQKDPWGSMTWDSEAVIDPATGQKVTKWTQNTTLDPRLQQALDSQIDMQNQRSQMAEGLMGRVESEFGTPMNWGNLTDWGTGPQAGNLQAITDPMSFAGERQRAEDAIYKSATSRLDPQWQQRQGDLETQLANRGITRNSAAFEREMNNMNQSRNDAYSQAQMAAITGGGAEAQRDLSMRLGAEQQAFGQQQAAGSQNFGQELQGAQFANQQRQQQVAEAMQQRGFSLNEIQALLNGQQVNTPQFSSFMGANSGGGTDYTGAMQNAYGAQLDASNAKQAGQASTMGAVGAIGGAALMVF
jgi:hypothetical protein